MNLVNLPVMPDYDSEQQLFAAVVNTLTEFDSIETVSIFLNGCNDITANGSLPPQKHGKYALNVENAEIATSGSAKPLTLYFPNESGSLMIPITRYAEGSTDLYSCIQQLAAGTDLRGLRSCFPENTLVLGAVIENGILTVNLSSVLLLVALGGCFSERSGIINIGLEGIMVIGALGGVMVLHNLSPQLPGIVILLLTVAASIAAGMIYSLLLAVASINFKADQTLVGTAMNMLGLALATVIAKAYNIATTSGADNSARIAFVENKKALALVEGTEFNWFMVLAFAALAVGWVVLYKTRFGLRLMACGEHPQAADSVGINVKKMRYSGVLISGAVGGLGGIAYVTAGVSMCNFEVGVAGFGFLALAVMIFGQWKPLRIAIAALLFGFFRALANVYSGFDFLTALNIPKPVYNMLPYIISLIVLAFTSKKSLAPKAEGIPYDKGSR